MKAPLVVYFIILVFNFDLFCQNKTVEASGQVLDAKTMQPVPFASARFLQSSIGISCNENGYFRLFTPYYQNDTLQISCIGYETVFISASNLNQKTIVLRPVVVSLNEVTIIKEIPIDEILVKMLEALREKHISSPHQQWGFYKTSTNVAGKYVGFSENLCAIYNQGYNENFSKDKYKYLSTDMSKNTETRASNYSYSHNRNGYPGKGIEALGLLTMKKNIIHGDLLSKNTNKYFDWTIQDKVYLKDEIIYILAFSPKENYLKKRLKEPEVYSSIFRGIYAGRVFVNAKNGYVPTKIEIETAPYTTLLKKIINKSTNYISELKEELVTIQYENFRGNYFLSRISYEQNYLDFGWSPNESPAQKVKISSELNITTLNNKLISNHDLSTIFGEYEQFDDIKLQTEGDKYATYRPVFWGKYPIDNILIEDLQTSNTPLETQFKANSNRKMIDLNDCSTFIKFYTTKTREQLINQLQAGN